jgi:hypothetical protein
MLRTMPDVPATMRRSLRELEKHARDMESARAARDQLVVDLVEAGVSTTLLGATIGLTESAVRQIVRRRTEDT